METVVNINGRRFLNVRRAVSTAIISSRTARSWLVRNNVDIIKVADEDMIDLDVLSATVQNRIINYLKKCENNADDNFDDKLAELEFILIFVYTSDVIWRKNLPRFSEMYIQDSQREILGRTFAFVNALIGMKSEGYQLKQIYQAYANLSSRFELSNFKCNSYDYFTLKLKDAEEHGIEKAIVNAKRSVIRLAKKVTKTHVKFLIKFYSDPARFKYKKIQLLVNNEVIKLGLKPISLSSVKMFLAQPEIQNTYKPFRYGKKWAENMLYPYLIRAHPLKTNYLWQSDCTCLNFYVYNESGDPCRTWLCIVIDTKSRKILAHCIGDYETTALVENTLMQAIINYRVLPFQILHDNSAAFTSKRIEEIEKRMAEFGTCIRKSRPENPRDKGSIESLLGYAQNYFRNERGYLGDGVRSFKEEGRVDPSERKAYFEGKKNGIWKMSEFTEMVNRVVHKLNAKEL